MARPTKPKDVKPKAVEGGGDKGGAPVATQASFDLKFIVTMLTIIVVGLAGPSAAVYFIGPMVVPQGAVDMGDGGHDGHGSGGGLHETLGMNLELDEFTVNLKSDPSQPGHQYLRTKMSLSVKVPMEEFCDPHGDGEHAALPVELALTDSGVIAGAAANTNTEDMEIASGGGGGVDPYVACQQAFNTNMARFVPTMRDIINTALMKRTAGNLESIEGQEALKDDIKDQVNHLMGDKYGVIRVNFSDFIIQK